MTTGGFVFVFGLLVYLSAAFGSSGDALLDMTREPIDRILQRVALATSGMILLLGGCALLAGGVP